MLRIFRSRICILHPPSHSPFSTYYVSSLQHQDFLRSNSFLYNSQRISGHQINSLSGSRNTTVVVGGGVIGVTTALYLCQNTNDNVVLLEKQPQVAQETSNANGGIMGIEYNIMWVSKAIAKHYWNSLVQRDYPFKFKLRALFEKHMWRWILNMLVSVRREEENLDKIDNLAQLSGKEFNKLLGLIPGSSFDVTAKGLLSIYDDEHDFEKKNEFYERKTRKGYKIEDVPIGKLLEMEPVLSNSNEKFVKAIYWPVETNFETEKFSKAIVKYCLEHYQNRFKLLTETKAEGFMVHAERKEVIGVTTDKGVVGMDRVVVAAGLQSVELLNVLNVKCLLAPVKGYTLSVPVSDSKGSVNTIVSDEKKRLSFAQIGDVIRIAAFAEFAGRDKSVEEKRKQQIIANLQEKIGDFPLERANIWVGLRPVSPDDVPVIGKVDSYKNLFVNAGHGSKGSTLSLGAARVLLELMNPSGNVDINFQDYAFDRFY